MATQSPASELFASKYLYLCPLRSVNSVDRILERHGPSLKGLVIEVSAQVRTPRGTLESDAGLKYPKLDASNISRLAQQCPNLEEIRLQIKRSNGSQAECEMYKALGNS